MSNAPNLTVAERAAAADLFSRAADQFSNHGCNDYPLPDTPENRQFLADVWRWAGNDEEADRVMSFAPGTTLCGCDWMLMRYLSAKLLEM